jgi:hypothetical protein
MADLFLRGRDFRAIRRAVQSAGGKMPVLRTLVDYRVVKKVSRGVYQVPRTRKALSAMMRRKAA